MVPALLHRFENKIVKIWSSRLRRGLQHFAEDTLVAPRLRDSREDRHGVGLHSVAECPPDRIEICRENCSLDLISRILRTALVLRLSHLAEQKSGFTKRQVVTHRRDLDRLRSVLSRKLNHPRRAVRKHIHIAA